MSTYGVLCTKQRYIFSNSVIATSLTNGISDAHKFKSRSQVHAAQEFNRFNSLGQVRICPVRHSRPYVFLPLYAFVFGSLHLNSQVVITANWRVIVGMAVLLLLTYVYLLRQATD